MNGKSMNTIWLDDDNMSSASICSVRRPESIPSSFPTDCSLR